MKDVWVRSLVLSVTVFLYAIMIERFWPDRNKFVSGLISAFLIVSLSLILNYFWF